MFIDIMLVLILVSIWMGLYQIVKQQGRILIRLESLETHPPQPTEPAGLPVGSHFPNFDYPDLAGSKVRLDDFRTQQVLLVHWSPDCGYCEMIAAELAGLQQTLSANHTQALLLAHGTAIKNRELAEEHGLTIPILLLDGNSSCEPFESMGTPVAYLLDGEGRTVQPVAIGYQDVMTLARNSIAPARAKSKGNPRALPGAQPISESQIVRDGLKAGTVAPAFRLPDVRNGSVALDDFRGSRVLLVFSDPHCGPCDAVAPELARFHKQHKNDGLTLIMVGRGDRAENRQKADQFGIQFPVVLQEKWKLSRQYGIFATPVAFLVGEDGVLMQDVAIGAEAIMALARKGLSLKKDREHALSA